MIQPDKTLLQYLKLDPTHVINLTFDDYYFYPDTLINTKTKQIIRNLKLTTLLPLSRQINHPITLKKNIETSNLLPNETNFQIIFYITLNDKPIYIEWVTLNDNPKSHTYAKKHMVNAMILHQTQELNVTIHDPLSPNNYNIINI